MAYKILHKKQLSESIYTAKILAPLVAKSWRAGQFVMICINKEYSERIPLTIVDSDPERGTIRLVWQRVGKTTAELSDMNTGDELDVVVGPLGRPTLIELFGTVVCVGGGLGNAPLLPIAKALKEANNTIVSIIGAKSRDLLILESEFRQISDELIITTDDGSYGQKNLVTEPLRETCQRDRKPDMVFAIGPGIMMKSCCEVTKQFGIPTRVSLNTVMVDGTGMCGGCRAEVDGEARFVCVDGPEFNGHEVDFDLMMRRLDAYEDQERRAYDSYRKRKREKGIKAEKAGKG